MQYCFRNCQCLVDPVWGIWLGRKTCIPSAPVLVGLKDNQDAALRLLIGDKPLESFTRQEEVETFAEGRDTLPDAPVSFATAAVVLTKKSENITRVRESD